MKNADNYFFFFCNKGPGLEEADAALVRSNFPMRSQTGIFYFEMKVISKGAHGFIGIGFCYGENNLERLPGRKNKNCNCIIN